MRVHSRWLFSFSLFLGLAAITRGVDEHGGSAFLSGGISGVFKTEQILTFMVDDRLEENWKGIHPWTGFSWQTDGAIFAGGGALYTLPTTSAKWSVTLASAPGYYERHKGINLGCHLEFCSFAEISRNLSGNQKIVLRLMHISNGGLRERNPGDELLMLGYGLRLPIY